MSKFDEKWLSEKQFFFPFSRKLKGIFQILFQIIVSNDVPHLFYIIKINNLL